MEKRIFQGCFLGIVTAASFGVFSMHYLLRIDAEAYMLALYHRFFARNITTNVSIKSLISGYLYSFWYAWVLATVLVCLLSVRNYEAYRNNEHYIWPVDYRENNQLLTDYVNEQYPNGLYASDSAIRGYMNLLFERGIYEWCSESSAAEIAEEKGEAPIVFIQKEGYALQSITVYSGDLSDGIVYTVCNGQVVASDLQEADIE